MLERKREEIQERLRASADSARPVGLDEPIGRLSRVDAMLVQQMAKAQKQRDETQLQLIASALARIRAGTFGECLRCEEEIDLERLKIAPESAQCVACRRASETS